MELGSWASYEMVLRYAHLAADHLRGACRIDDTFAQTKARNECGLRKALKSLVAGEGIEPPTRGFSIPCSTN